MKTIIAGSRTITDESVLRSALSLVHWEITEVVCGMAPGIDSLGADWAIDNNIPVSYYPADWRKYGYAAGPIRNKEMAENADALLLIWDGHSRGSKNMYQTWLTLKSKDSVVSVVTRG